MRHNGHQADHHEDQSKHPKPCRIFFGAHFFILKAPAKIYMGRSLPMLLIEGLLSKLVEIQGFD